MKNYSLTWLPPVLRAAGLEVIEQPGWQTRGHGDMDNVLGVICHHTAEAISASVVPNLKTLTDGRPGLAGPLCNLGLDQDGKFYMVAAGLAWHAGVGRWKGITGGNRHFIGVEAKNNGIGEHWPDIQKIAYAKGSAAMALHCHFKSNMVIGHKEWAPKRKIDPSFDMVEFRKMVDKFMQELR